MNCCNDRHEHMYEITYKPAKSGAHSPKWMVCNWCYEQKGYFGNPDEIESIAQLAS